MALLRSRTLLQTFRRSFSHTTPCLYAKEEKLLPDPLELATGLEKRELLAAAAGNFDPYYMIGIKASPDSTRENPNLIPSVFDSRVVGCVCEEDACHVKWMWLHAGPPKRCACGFWFKIVKKEPL